MCSHGLCPTILKHTGVTAGFKTLTDQIWSNTSVSTSSDVIFSDISDYCPIFAHVKELGGFSDNDDSFVTIKGGLRNSEQDSKFRSLLEHIQCEIYCGTDNVYMLCGTFISGVTTAYDSADPIISER